MKKILIISGEIYELNCLIELINYLLSKNIQIDIIYSIKNLTNFTLPECLSKCNIIKEINGIYNFTICTGLISNHLNIENQILIFIGHGGLGDCNSSSNFVNSMLEIIKKQNGYYLALNERLLLESKCKGIAIGWPKSDRILIGKKNDNIKKKLLITGHWNQNGLWHNIGLNLLYELISFKKIYDISVTLHPRLFNDQYRFNDYNLGKLIELFCEEFNLNFNIDFDISNLIIDSDIIVSDISSLTCECSVLNKPIIWYRGNFKYSDTKLEDLIKKATYECNTTNEIIEKLKSNLLPKTNELNALKNYCYTNIGCSNQKIIDFINNFL
jgi:hypothetical protein